MCAHVCPCAHPQTPLTALKKLPNQNLSGCCLCSQDTGWRAAASMCLMICTLEKPFHHSNLRLGHDGGESHQAQRLVARSLTPAQALAEPHETPTAQLTASMKAHLAAHSTGQAMVKPFRCTSFHAHSGALSRAGSRVIPNAIPASCHHCRER